ncbi:collagen alpha-1(I) chain-like [Balaenoptera ricei]|uniref:collagen alpha-1(I) chain-like n=1 Tax=Balaenoptera ricei TaxID=2746895 RepID=UPI0028BDD174|nr:collagen alpha-1(I) chain-like [Balaenoptera ricei]
MADEKDHVMEDARDVARDLQGRGLTPVAPDSLPPGSGGVVACLQAWKQRGPEGTPSPKTCLKLPLMTPLGRLGIRRQNLSSPRGNKDHKLSEPKAGPGVWLFPSDQLGGSRAEGGGAARGPGKVTFAPGRGNRRGPGTPRSAPSHLPEGPDCGPDARGPCRPPTRLGSRRLRTYPAPRCCLPARRARSRAHSRFLLPGRAAGRWRFLPDASRRPAPPAGCAGSPGRAGRPAVLRVRRPLPAAGRLAPGRSRRLSGAPAAETRCPRASPGTRARAPAQREVRPPPRRGRKVQRTPRDPA